MENENMDLELVQKRDSVINTIQNAVSEYYNIDFTKNNEETLKKKQNIAMFVSKLISTVDKNGVPAIMNASETSIRECALAFVNGDFDFFRNQAYLIAYGSNLTFIVSKDGLVTGAKRIVPNLELFSDIVYKGDTFEYEKIGGRTTIKKHEQPIENITCKIEDIVCAYAVAWIDGKQVEADIMTMTEIKNALITAHRSLTDFHKNNPKIMLGKFPLRRLAKKIVNQNIAPEVERVINTSDMIEIDADNVVPNNEHINIDFNIPVTEKITGTSTAKKNEPPKEQVQQSMNVEEISTPFDNASTDYDNSNYGVSIFDMMNKPQEEYKTVQYADWKNGLKAQMPEWEMVRNSYDENTKAIKIKKVR